MLSKGNFVSGYVIHATGGLPVRRKGGALVVSREYTAAGHAKSQTGHIIGEIASFTGETYAGSHRAYQTHREQRCSSAPAVIAGERLKARHIAQFVTAVVIVAISVTTK